MTDDRCIHHNRCRSDHARGNVLCGFRHVKNWNWCIWFREYEHLVRLEKSKARIAKRKAASETVRT